ncbi:MAG: cox cluster protein [Halarchaeum sp.]
MSEQPGLSEQYRTASPWPVFVALGLVLSEVGVFIGGPILPVGVGGVLLLEGSVVGILRESGYADHLWTTALAVGAVVTALGAVLVVYGDPGSALHVYQRGLALAGAGVLAALGALGLALYEHGYL